MDAKELLLSRVSSPLLQEPGPSDEQLELMFKAAVRAPDHGAIRPWRFLTIQGDARQKLGELFLEAALEDTPELSEVKREKTLKMPYRAPMVVVVISANRAHPKVPVIEQEVATGCAAQNILHAAFAQGVGAMWRTGTMAYHSTVRKGLGVSEDESIIGFIYLGAAEKMRKAPQHNLDDYVFEWTGS